MFRSALVFANSSSSVLLGPDVALGHRYYAIFQGGGSSVVWPRSEGRKRPGHSCLICKPNIGRACLFSDITQNFDIEVR